MGQVKILVLLFVFFFSGFSQAITSLEKAQNLLLDGAWKGYLSRIEQAITAGADVNARGIRSGGKWTALQLAALGGHAECLKYLIDHGAKVYATRHLCGATPLHWAAFESSLYERCSKILLEAVAAEAKKLGLDPDNAVAEYINIPTYDFEVALHWASKRLDSGCLIFVLEQPGTKINLQDHQGQTALHHGIEHKRLESLKILLEAKADADKCDTDGRTPLHYSAHRGKIKYIKILLKHGANINAQNKEGQTALHEAVEQGHKKAVKFLLKKGADATIKDNLGRTAKDLVQEYKELKKILKRVGKKKHRS